MIADKLLSFTLMGAGWVLWLLVGLSVVSVTVIVERGVYFWRRRMSHRFPRLLALAQAGDLADAGEIAEGDSMEAEVARVAGLRSRNHEEVAEAISSVIEKRRLSYEQGLFILGTLGNNAPFVGLFGTVLGIIRAFADLANSSKAGAQTVMAGISEALVATAVGLFVAIPAVLAFNVFQRLLKRVVGRSNALAHAIAAGLHAEKEAA
ncbi:MAG TPA: MotA/TolQ/ExbB proton channel family protein [Myxococcales bacterium]|nr:MotA/TolQ/ExbB proton channel family protein [Myxococcales bacterium]